VSDRPPYLRILATFLRNSMVRDMSFRSNFWIECFASTSWVAMNLGFYLLIFRYAPEIGYGTGWGQYQFFVFLATTMFINGIVQMFFMPNAIEFSELIRTGGLDFALLKPIDTQFLISLQKINWTPISNMAVAAVLLTYSLIQLAGDSSIQFSVSPLVAVLYPLFMLCGVAILYSLMIVLAAVSVWLGRNQALNNFWFSLTNFSRYPMEIYNVRWGIPLMYFFTLIVPILVVVNVPARLLAQPISPRQPWEWWLTGFGLLAAVLSVAISRWVFVRALKSYRSASS